VVLVLDHGEEGALGVVLNRPTPVEVEEILEPWGPLARRTPPGVVFRGGPVSPDAVIGLVKRKARADDPAGWRTVIESVGTVDLSVPPDDQAPGLVGVRLFSGYAGWAATQLEAERDEGAWYTLGALAADVFCPDAERLWHDVLQRQGGRLALLAGYPPHPSFN
jgi:putative transcriptional regulator